MADRTSSAAETPSNPGLVRAIDALLGAPDYALDLMIRPLLTELVDCTLVGGREPLLLQRGGEEQLALFTDLVELHLFEPDEPWATMRADDAIKAVARGTYGGLVINPGPRQFQLSREDVRDFFDIDED